MGMTTTTLIDNGILKQHLIDPEICIRCNTCEATCPVGAITHDDNNYVVRADVCNGCMACISPCPTGSIDNWRTMPLARAYSIEEQLTWEELPPELTPDELAAVPHHLIDILDQHLDGGFMVEDHLGFLGILALRHLPEFDQVLRIQTAVGVALQAR